MKKVFLLISIILPLASLVFLTISKIYTLNSGLEYILPISGFDPIDPLSGHYVTYRIDYGTNICENKKTNCICLKLGEEVATPLESCMEKPIHCDSIIRGNCKNGRFEAGIEKFFIPESRAEYYDTVVRKGKSKLIISVDPPVNPL